MDQQQLENDQEHEEWLAAIGTQLAPIFDNSREGVYVYLDDRHKICNEKLAKMWGYRSAAEWAATPDFLESFVASQPDRVQVSTTYHQHVHRELTAYDLRYTVKRKDGRKIKVVARTVPLAYDGQLFAYTFIQEVPATKS
jgi:hypothetical protein